MICIECMEPVRSLYTRYSRSNVSNIRLTACPRCNKFADKYIEYDSVLVFVDVILLKPQAYRHLVFNVFTREKQVWGSAPITSTPSAGPSAAATQSSTSSLQKSHNGTNLSPSPTSLQKHGDDSAALHSVHNHNTRRRSSSSFLWPLRVPLIAGLHVQAQRLWLLVTLFDVYLTWARAEQRRAEDARYVPVLALPVLAQYSSFLILCLAESLTTHCVLRALAIHVLRWRGAARMGQPRAKISNENGPGNPAAPEKVEEDNSEKTVAAAKAALSTALLISSSSKLFPILMVIWSYDVPFAATVLGWAVSFNTIEALTIILQCGYLRAGLMTAAAAAVRNVLCDHVVLPLLQIFWTYLL